MMGRTAAVLALCLACLLSSAAPGLGGELQEFIGVVPLRLKPAPVVRVNEIVPDPAPGSSYIGKESVLVQVPGNPDLQANWAVVEIEYTRYPEPKTIRYRIGSEEQEITVRHRAEELRVTGNLKDHLGM